MKLRLAVLACLAGFYTTAFADEPDISIPTREIALIKTTDYVEVSGTNDLGGAEDFTIHNTKAIRDFVELLTSERFNAVPQADVQVDVLIQGPPVIEGHARPAVAGHRRLDPRSPRRARLLHGNR
jgi:hypothetical protein